MAFCLHHSLALSAGVFVNAVETTPDVLVWDLDRDRGLLGHGKHARLRGHAGQVRPQAREGGPVLCTYTQRTLMQLQ